MIGPTAGCPWSQCWFGRRQGGNPFLTQPPGHRPSNLSGSKKRRYCRRLCSEESQILAGDSPVSSHASLITTSGGRNGDHAKTDTKRKKVENQARIRELKLLRGFWQLGSWTDVVMMRSFLHALNDIFGGQAGREDRCLIALGLARPRLSPDWNVQGPAKWAARQATTLLPGR